MAEQQNTSPPGAGESLIEGWLRRARQRSVKEWVFLLGPVIALVVIYLLFIILLEFKRESGMANPFLTLRQVETMARQTAIVGMAALGMTLIIIAGGIDLSIGSVIAFTCVVIAWLLQHAGFGPLTAALGGIIAGAICGLINGALTTFLKIVPFIVTLGMMLVVRGAAKYLGDNQKIDVDDYKGLNVLVRSLPKGSKWMIFPPGVWLLIVLAIGVWVLLKYTRFGKHIVAIGSNEQTARLCGINVQAVKVLVYTIGGAFAGLAGLMLFSRLTVGDPTSAMGEELNVIAAVVIGGGSLSGGEGSVLGSLVGALVMTVIRSGCTQMGLPSYVQEILAGIIIVSAVALDNVRRRRAG
jgi:ribose/xylose/arabinose/galactoside ABC-type transport system permease subunit